MSKSGLFAHFGSKEELQLATIDTAPVASTTRVVGAPAPSEVSGIGRLRSSGSSDSSAHVEDSVFPGGCFFASVAAEVDTHPGPVRDRALAFVADWITTLRQAVAEAQAGGAIDPAEDPDQLRVRISTRICS